MAKFRQVSHVIFDMDGVILDTEPLYTKAVQNVLNKYNRTFTWEVKAGMMGLHRFEASKYIVNKLNLPITWEEYDTEIHKEYQVVLANPTVFPGTQKLIRHLSKHNIPISVATSSSLESFELKSAQHKDLFKLFDHIVCGSSDPDVKQGKPAPDIFLVSAARFPDKPNPEKCLVLEDSPNGVQAAISAGMQVIMVPDENIPMELREAASFVVSSVDETPLEKFGLPPL
ncbi:probable pseudouridine-5'-phosphatase isoform X1 [Euwallacea similis]|uniref:probable pseudouridine-5'-phosphatase isoform X1 n=1 Tax=Euwallacea similis TaxID=1736056 RepID=UPI00344C094A